ncbi:MAG: TolC family protein [Desulfobulbaceae bacterium]|jgi:outer membrane protein TolC|nr:TolC family protein [Desulfobulbaceae bacterium]
MKAKRFFLGLAALALLIGASSAHAAATELHLSLYEAIQYALAHNRDLAKGELNLQGSRLAVETAKSAFDLKVVPSSQLSADSSSERTWLVGARASKTFASGLTASARPTVGNWGGEPYSLLSVALDAPLLRGFGEEYAMAGVDSSLYALQSARLAQYSQQISVVLQTVQAVYGIVQKNMRIDVLAEQQRLLRHHLEIVKIKERAGLAEAMDAYRAEIRLKDLEDELTVARQDVDDALGELKKLLAIPQAGLVTINAPLDYAPSALKTDEAVAIAMKHRIDVEQSARLERETERQLRLAKNNLLPRLDLEVSYNLSGDNRRFSLDDETWLATVTSDGDVFRVAEKNAYEQQLLQYRAMKLDQETLRENISREVRAEIGALNKHDKRIGLLEAQLHQTSGKMRLAESKFRNGMADNFVLLEAQEEMQRARTDLFAERIAAIVGLYRFRSVLGTLLARQSDTP